MKVLVATLLMVAVTVVSTMPQAEPEPEPEPMPQMDADTLARLKMKRKDNEMMMMATKGCMMKRMLARCACTSIDDCPVVSTMLKCHKSEMMMCLEEKSLTSTGEMTVDQIPVSQKMLDAVDDKMCDSFLPPSKVFMGMMLRDQTAWHSMGVCMMSHGQYEMYQSCVLDEIKSYIPSTMQ